MLLPLPLLELDEGRAPLPLLELDEGRAPLLLLELDDGRAPLLLLELEEGRAPLLLLLELEEELRLPAKTVPTAPNINAERNRLVAAAPPACRLLSMASVSLAFPATPSGKLDDMAGSCDDEFGINVGRMMENFIVIPLAKEQHTQRQLLPF